MAFYKFFQEAMDQCQTTWIISDSHFGEQDLKDAYPNRPSDEDLVKAINKICGKSDFLICLGDVGNQSYVSQLRAKKKWLILGNHDGGASNYERKVWTKQFDKDKWQKDEALQEMKRLHPNCRYSIDEGYRFTSPSEFWEVKADNNLFTQTFEGPVLVSEKLILSHEPIDVPWAYNIHGHCHDAQKNERGTNICLDACDYKPLNFKQFMKSGAIGNVKSLHRDIIDNATERCKKRGYRLVGQKRK